MANILFLERFSLNDKTLLYCNLRGAAQFGKKWEFAPNPPYGKNLISFPSFCYPPKYKTMD